jgi:hypothetical protein
MSEYKDKVEQEQDKDTSSKQYTSYQKQQQTSTEQEEPIQTDTYIRKWTDALATDYLE